jgi:hypothetical protein
MESVSLIFTFRCYSQFFALGWLEVGHYFDYRNHLQFVDGRSVTCGPGSSVGIVTAYGLDCPGIESRWGEIFRTSPDQP